MCSLALGVLAGCSEEVEYEMPIYDFVNPSVCFFVSDAATGVNLLDPDEPDAILGYRPIAVTYGGKRYEVAADAARPRDAGLSRCRRGRWRCGSKG